MSRVYLVGQRPLKEEECAPRSRLMFFSNKEHPETKRPYWYSGLPDDYVEEPVSDTKKWLKNEGFDAFLLEFIYD